MFGENNDLLRFSKHSFKRKIIIDCIIIVILVLVIALLSTARAASTRSHVVDNADVLAEYQVDNIKAELSTLKDIKLVIVINNVGNRCTDDYAYTAAKSLCQETFVSEENGMVIAYCSSLEGYKIGIYCQENLENVDTKQLKDKIVSEYSLYSTDSSWIEGSSIQAIIRINEMLHPTGDSTPDVQLQEDVVPKKINFWEVWGKYQVISSILFAVFLAGIITAVVVYKKHHKQIDKNIDYWFKNKEG